MLYKFCCIHVVTQIVRSENTGKDDFRILDVEFYILGLIINVMMVLVVRSVLMRMKKMIYSA